MVALALFFWPGIGFTTEPGATVIDAPTQEKVAQLLQTVIQDYWNADETKNATLTNTPAISTNVEAAFRNASKLMPDRLDLRFGIASALVGQAIQTNGQQLQIKLKGALQVYQEIASLDTNGFDAPILYAAYARALGETNESQNAINGLMILHPQRTTEYVRKFDLIDRVLQLRPDEKARRNVPKHTHTAIVVLGAGLETNGTIKAKLAGRLEQARKVARFYPRAPIILTGGNQKGGVTEAYVMSQWCLRKGIHAKRLILEDKARDTVENALFCSAILKRLGVNHATLVTSSNHIHRGLADFEEACRQHGLTIRFDTLTSRSRKETDLDAQQERVGIYRDVLRASGLWAFPGLRR